MKRILVMIFVALFTITATNAQTSGNKRNKCLTCGKLITACQYHGKHTRTTPKPKPKVDSNTNHEVQRAQEIIKYPEWFNQSTMKAIPMADGKVLIVYNQISHFKAWDDIPDPFIISGIPGDWEIAGVNEEICNLILSSGLYVPEDGLYSRKIGSGVNLEQVANIKRNGVVFKTLHIPNESKHLTIYTITPNGTKEFDCGEYSKKGELQGLEVNINTKDNRKYFTIWYYPYRVITKSNGSWIIEKTTRLIEESATSTSTSTRAVKY